MALSNPQVIERLNKYFVPVYLANSDYREGGAAPTEEKAELQRILREGHAAKLSVGSVHAFVLSPEGRTMDSRHVAQAYKADGLVPMLDAAAEKFGVKAGAPVVKPAPPEHPKPEAGSLLLHVTARYLERKGNEYVLIESGGGDWSALPGEDWVRLPDADVKKLLGPKDVKVGATWEVDRDVAATLLNRFYPPTENNDLAKNRMDEQTLKATVVSVEKGRATARLDGRLRMKHPFYHKDDENSVDATVVGFVEWESRTGAVRSLRLVTDEATYGDTKRRLPFGVAVRALGVER